MVGGYTTNRGERPYQSGLVNMFFTFKSSCKPCLCKWVLYGHLTSNNDNNNTFYSSRKTNYTQLMVGVVLGSKTYFLMFLYNNKIPQSPRPPETPSDPPCQWPQIPSCHPSDPRASPSSDTQGVDTDPVENPCLSPNLRK